MKKKENEGLPIHQRVKKHEMVFEYILMGIISAFLLYCVLSLFNVLPAHVLIAGIFAALYLFFWQLQNAISSKTTLVSLGLDAKVDGKDVLITASITNIGTKSINPEMTNLYIMEGVSKEKDGYKEIVFPRITDHKYNKREGSECFNCAVMDQCAKERKKLNTEEEKVLFPGVSEIKTDKDSANNSDKDFEHTIKIPLNLRLLSYHSLMHVMPKEMFTEEVIISLPKPGYYRVFMIYTDKKWKDCICRSLVVHIEDEVLLNY